MGSRAPTLLCSTDLSPVVINNCSDLFRVWDAINDKLNASESCRLYANGSHSEYSVQRALANSNVANICVVDLVDLLRQDSLAKGNALVREGTVGTAAKSKSDRRLSGGRHDSSLCRSIRRVSLSFNSCSHNALRKRSAVQPSRFDCSASAGHKRLMVGRRSSVSNIGNWLVLGHSKTWQGLQVVLICNQGSKPLFVSRLL